MPYTYRLTLYAEPPSNAPSDLSADLVRAEWRLGCPEPDALSAPPGIARFTLLNRDGRYSAARAYALPALNPAARLTFDALDAADQTVIRLFTGQISAITSDGNPAQPVVVITARTLDDQLADLPAAAPPQVATNAGAACAALLDALPLRRPDQIAYWLLDTDDQARLGQTTALAAPFSALCDLQPGIAALPYVAFGAGGERADTAVAQLVASERGRWYADRFDTLHLRNRHAALRGQPVAVSITDDPVDLDYTWGADVVGRVRVVVGGWTVGPPGTALWTLESSLRLDPGVRELTVNFRWNERPAVALRVAGLVMTAETAPGTGIAAPLVASLTQIDAASARLRLENPSAAAVYVLPGSGILGTPLTHADPVTIERHDPLALHSFGGRTLTLTPTLTTPTDADDIAAYEIGRRLFPSGRIAHVSVSAEVPGALAATLFTRVTVDAPSVADSVDAWIVGETHTLDRAAQPPHRIRWTLEPVGDAGYYLELGAGRLDSTAALAY